MSLRFPEALVNEQREWATNPMPRIPTGYPFFDRRTQGGIATGELLIFTCRPSVGKTTFGLNVIVNNYKVPSIFFSLEMHGRYIAHRLAAIFSSVPTEELERALRTEGTHWAYDRLAEGLPLLAVDDRPGMSLRDMAGSVEQYEETTGVRPKLIVIDFLELIGGTPALEKVEAVDRVAQKVKQFAREQDVAVILLHQVGRGGGGDGHLPLTLSSGRYGGEIAADYVMAAYRPAFEPGLDQDTYLRRLPIFSLQFLKTRGGSEIHPAGVDHFYDPKSMRLTAAEPVVEQLEMGDL